MAKISYAEVKQQVSMGRVLDLIGYVPLFTRGPNLRGPCPFRCCQKNRIAAFHLHDGWWRCFKCQRHGNQLDLYREVRGLSLYPAAVELCKRVGIEVPYLVFPTPGRTDRGCV